MSERVRIEHTFECSEESFWKLFLEDDYNRAMFVDYMKFPRWEVVESQDEGNVVKRTVEVEPYVADLPPAIKKVVGDTIRYREQGKLDKNENRYAVHIVPARMADKINVEGEQFTESLGENQCKRVFVADINVKVFGVGNLIEKRIAADLTRSYDLGAKFTHRYLKEHGIS